MFDKLMEAYKLFIKDMKENEKEFDTEKKENKKRAIFIKVAPTEEDAERLFSIAFYCHHTLEKKLADQLEGEWKNYYLNGKETSTPILPYYYYVLERIKVDLKDID